MAKKKQKKKVQKKTAKKSAPKKVAPKPAPKAKSGPKVDLVAMSKKLDAVCAKVRKIEKIQIEAEARDERHSLNFIELFKRIVSSVGFPGRKMGEMGFTKLAACLTVAVFGLCLIALPPIVFGRNVLGWSNTQMGTYIVSTDDAGESDIEIGDLDVNSDLNVDGNVVVAGSITFVGTLTCGDVDTTNTSATSTFASHISGRTMQLYGLDMTNGSITATNQFICDQFYAQNITCSDVDTTNTTATSTFAGHISGRTLQLYGLDLTNGTLTLTNNVTVAGTAQAEQLTSTDDALVVGTATVGDVDATNTAATSTFDSHISGRTLQLYGLDLTNGTVTLTNNATVAGTVAAEQLTSSDDALVVGTATVGDVDTTNAAATSTFAGHISGRTLQLYGLDATNGAVTLTNNATVAGTVSAEQLTSSDDALVVGTATVGDVDTTNTTATSTFASHISGRTLQLYGFDATNGTVTLTNNATVAGTVSAEQLTSTDDATVVGTASVGDVDATNATATSTFSGHLSGVTLQMSGLDVTNGTVTATNNVTAAGTVQGEQLTSTDDALVVGTATVGDVDTTNTTATSTFAGHISGRTLQLYGFDSTNGTVTLTNNATVAGTVSAEQLTSSDDALVVGTATVGDIDTTNTTATSTFAGHISGRTLQLYGVDSTNGLITLTNGVTAAATITAEQLTSTDDINATGDVTAGNFLWLGNTSASMGYFRIGLDTQLWFVATYTNGVALSPGVTNTVDADITN